jgi:hypothetical protein
MSKIGDTASNAVAFLFMLGLYGSVVWFIGSAIWDGFIKQPDCTEVVIAFQKETEGDNNLEVGKSELRTAGVNGKDRVCTKDNQEVSRTHILLPVNEVTAVGLKETPPVLDNNLYIHNSGGAICGDGSRSYSTGRGTCSHHGGVAEWL